MPAVATKKKSGDEDETPLSKGEALNVRLPLDLKAALDAAAEAEDRTIKSIVMRALKEYLSRDGFWPPSE